jgi:hypothetical protein
MPTPTDQWNKRTNAFSALVSLIPDTVEGDEEWFSNAKTLRHLASPLSSLLKDSRSTVVKRTCENCTVMFQRCGPIARYLMKDIMPAVMAVHAQTVQVIRTYVQTMISDALVHVPGRWPMPIWFEKLKTEKVEDGPRSVCHLSLIAIENWDLTRDIRIQVDKAR